MTNYELPQATPRRTVLHQRLQLQTPLSYNGIFLRLHFTIKKIPHKYYIGFTEDLESRLKSHNQGNNPHTSKYKPWRVKTAIALTDRQRALDFEKYLKNP